MPACYGSVMNPPKIQLGRQRLTEATRAQLRAAQDRVIAAEAELETAQKARNDLFVRLYDDGQGAGATEIGRVVDLHRTVVQRVLTPPH